MDFAFFAIFDSKFEDFNISGFYSFAIPINKKYASNTTTTTTTTATTTTTNMIDFGQFSAIKYIPTEISIVLVRGEVKRDFKTLRKKRQKIGKSKIFSKNFRSIR